MKMGPWFDRNLSTPASARQDAHSYWWKDEAL